MDFGLTKEFFLLLGVWGVFIGAFLLFLRASSQGGQVADFLWKEGIPPLESIAGSPSEKRIYQRKRLPLTVSYAVLDKPDCQGTALSKDISKGGVCIPLPASLQRGSRVRLSIQLPRDRRPLSVWGEVVWQSSLLSNAASRFETGIRFIRLDPSNILTIARSL